MLRALWAVASSEAEARTYLQTRLTVLFKLTFWSFIALLLFMVGTYAAYPGYQPRNNAFVYLVFSGGLAMMAFIWRGLLVRRTLSFDQLHAVDLFYAIGANSCISACALISADFHPSVYTCLIYSCFTVLVRALIIPSTGLRTAVVDSPS